VRREVDNEKIGECEEKKTGFFSRLRVQAGKRSSLWGSTGPRRKKRLGWGSFPKERVVNPGRGGNRGG